MKKIFMFLALIAVLGVNTPAFAAPPPPPPHHIHAGYRHDMRRPLPPPHHGYYRPHSNFAIYTSFPRYRHHHFCNCPHCMAHRPFYGTGFYISF